MASNREQRILNNMKLVDFTISKYTKPGYTEHNPLYSKEDLRQIGMIGLINAVDTYDEKKGAFSTYAVMVIRNQIYQAFNYQSHHEDTNDFGNRPEILPDYMESSENPEEHILYNDTLSDILRFVPEGRKEKFEKLFTLISLGYNTSEAARMTCLSNNSAYKMLNKIRKNDAIQYLIA